MIGALIEFLRKVQQDNVLIMQAHTTLLIGGSMFSTLTIIGFASASFAKATATTSDYHRMLLSLYSNAITTV